MKLEGGVATESDGDQGSGRVRVGTASEERGLPGGDRTQTVEVLSGQILHQCPGPRGQGAAGMLD